MASTKKKKTFLDIMQEEEEKKNQPVKKYEPPKTTLLDDAAEIIHKETLRTINNVSGTSPYKNLAILREKTAEEQKKNEKKSYANSLLSDADNIIASGMASYNVAERKYIDSLPNDAYRFAYKQSKNTDGMYVSPYFSKGIEGKEKLKYNNDNWNKLPEATKKKYLEWAQQELETQSKSDKPNLNRTNEALDYAMAIVNETDRYITKVGDMYVQGTYNNKNTFDADQEVQIMLNMMPQEVRNYLATGYAMVDSTDERFGSPEAIKAYLSNYYSDDMIDKLSKAARHIENIRGQQERNESTETSMEDPFYATALSQAKRIGADIFVKPVASVIDNFDYAKELEKGIYGEFDPLRTEAQKIAEDARYIAQSTNEGLGKGGQFVYNLSVSGAESLLRQKLAVGIADSMPFVDTEKAAKVILPMMVSSSVFNDSFNENIQKGMPIGDAGSSAFAHAITESLFEELSFDKLGYFDTAPVLRSKKEFLKAMLKAGFVEGSEEAFTDIANELYDHYAGSYDFSEYKAFKDKYLASHPDATDAEVWWNFTKQFSLQVAQSFAGGALSSFALSATHNAAALNRGEVYIQNGQNVSDADYARMNAFVEDLAKVNPNVANELEQATEGGEDARRGFVKMKADEYSNKFNKEIERADSKDKLNLVMNNVNSVMNGAISEDTFNTYNAKLVELGETPADYNTFVQNRQRGGNTTFSDLAYGRGDNAIQRNIVEASNSIGEVQENANLSESERETAISDLVNKVNANLEKAEDLITRYTAMGKALDSPEIRQFESIMPLEKIAKIHSDAKADLGLVNAAQQLPAVKRSAVVKFADNDELHRVLGKDSVGHVSALTMNEIRSNSDYYATYHFAELLSRLTGAKYALFKSDRTDKQKNGAYDPNTDTTYIDVEAGKSSKARATGGAFTHEFVHETRRKSEELYQRLKNFVQNDLGDSWNGFVQERMKPREEGGLGLDQNKAEEEVVAEACQRMLENSETFKKYALADYKGAKTFRDKLAEFVTRLKQMLNRVFKGDIDTRVTEAINDIEGLQKEFDQVLEEVIKMPSENDAESVKEAMEGKENIVEEMVKNADGEMEIAKMSDGTIMYSETTYRSGGRSAIANALKEKGHTQAEINKVVKYIDNRLNYIREVGIEFATKSFDKLAKNLEADITTDLATEAEILKRIEESGVLSQEVINNLRSAHQIAYAYVSNGDYPMNIDLQLSCKKRIAYEMIINKMIESGLMGDVRMSGEFIGEINTILAAHEFETQCLGCFVESRRLQMQKWAETFVSEWNQQVEKVTGKKRANATKDDYLFHGENAAGVDDAYAAHLQLEEAIKSGERNRAGNGGIVLKERSVFNKMGELIDFNKEFYGKFLTVEDILTADGLKKLRALDNGNLFSLVKSRYGVASPKILQSFNPYNSEVLNLTFKSVSEMTGNSVAGAQDYLNAAKKNLTAADTAEINRIIDENYDGKNLTKSQRDELLKEMTARKVESDAIRQYLLDIGGNRIQSFSDFMIENVFDMLQIFADMSVRDYSMHGYTKEQICLRLFGMTGAKWNGSWISHNLKEMGKELSGLMPYTAENAKHGITVEVDGEKYVIQFDDYDRHMREKSFIQSIGFKDAIAIMLDPRYANNVGTITIGFSDKHIRAMLNSPYFRMVIPYHASGMIPGFAELVGASTYNDYTPYQTTGMNEIIVYENGTRKVLSAKEVKEKGEESVTKSSKGYKFTYKGTTYTVKPNMSFRFNEALQRLGDARAAAQEYVDWCRSEHALNIDGIDAYATFNPAFSNSPTGYDFTQEENYYKLLEDFNVYNSREEIINGTKVNARQEGVKLLYPGDEGGTLSAAELKQYEADLKQTGLFSDAEIQKYVKKAQMTFDELVRGEVANRNAYYEGVFGKNNEKFNSAYEEIKQASEKYKRNEQVAESKEQYLKSQEKAAKAKQNGNEKLLKAPAGTYLVDDSVRYSFRGTSSTMTKTDKENLSVAREMDEQGLDSEKIRLATGWFKGYDGRWRNELDDSKLKFSSTLIPNANEIRNMWEVPQILHDEASRELNSIADKMMAGVTAEERKDLEKRFNEVEKEVHNYAELVRRAEKNALLLTDLIDHPALFKAYPKLKDTVVRFTQGEKWAGNADASSNTINISLEDFRSAGDYLGTIMHEVQHIIQSIEGFASGSNTEYWTVNQEPSEDVQDAQAALNGVAARLNDIEYHGTPGASPIQSAIMYVYYKKSLREDKAHNLKTNIAFDEQKINDIEERAKNGGYYRDLMDYFHKAQDLEVAKAENSQNPYDLYLRTAGEVEARDVASRLNMSAKERKATRPDVDRNDVVFVKGKLNIGGYSIVKTNGGVPVVVIDTDILAGVPQDKWVEAADNALKNFSPGIPIYGKFIRVNAKTRGEYTESDNTKMYRANDGTIYEDKLRASGQVDEIVFATTKYVNEAPKHPRKDNIVQFARGKVLIRSGTNDYEADVVVGFTTGGNLLLYDVVEFTPTTKIKQAGLRPTNTTESSEIRGYNPATQNIPQSSSDVNTRDSEGNTLTQAQQEYFADSKVRDENGNLLLVHHGSPSTDITTFDKSKAGAHTNAFNDKAIWFTDDENFAEDFSYEFLQGSSSFTYRRGKKGKVYSGYLNLTNPFDITNPTEEMMDYINEKVGEEEAKRLLEIGNHQLIKIYLDASEIEALGYDGIIARLDTYERGGGVEYGAFESNQFKSQDNTNPTDSDDIRFASRDMANSESEMIVNAMTNDAALVDELGAKQSITAYARAYNEIQAMEKQSLQYSQQLLKASPSEREVLYKKLIRLNRAITNKTTELTEMRSQRVLRDVLINEWAKRLDDVEWTNELTYQRTKQALERKYGEEIVSLKAKNKEQQKAIRDRHEINKRKKNIEKKTKELMNRILHGTEKKHIPSVLVNPIVELLDSIDYWTPAENRPVTKKSESLRDRFLDFKQSIANYQEQIDKGADMIEYMFDSDFLDEVEELCNSVRDIKNVNDMNVDEITDLDHILTKLNHLIVRGNKMIVNSHFENLEEAKKTTAEELLPRDDVKKVAGSWRQRLNAGMADTFAFGEYAGNGARQIVDMLSMSNEKRIRQIREAKEFADKTLEGTGFRKWKKEEHTFTTEEGKDITMTVPQMMELYLLNNREQARLHIYGNGIRVEGKKGKFTKAVKVTESDVQEVINYLKDNYPTAAKVAEELQKYVATVLTGWGNEASNLLWGISKFTEPNYWQIRSDKSNMKADEKLEESSPERASLYRLQNLSRTKAVNKAANNEILIGDVFDTFLSAVDDMTAYSSILPAATDALRWFNSMIVLEDGSKIRVKKLLEDKLGTDMVKVFTESIKAMNGGIAGGNNTLEGLIGKMMGNVKAASVAANFRVTFQQPTAYTRAYSVMEAKYLNKALTMKPAIKEMQEHSAIGWWKSQGFYSNGLAPSLKKLILDDGSISEKITEKALIPAGFADDVTWGYLWNAAKLKVEDTQPNLVKGSQEYFDAIERVHSNVINQTQVVDTPLTKAMWMRSGGAGKSIAALYTAFQNEPMKTYSMVSTAIDKALRGEEGAKKIVTMAISSFALNAAVNALAQAIADAARDDDRKKSYWEKYYEKFKEDFIDNANPMTYIPVIKDAWSMWQGYRNSRLDMQGLQNAINAINEIDRIMRGKSERTLFGQMEVIAKAVSSLTGIPISNAMRTLSSIGNVAGIDIFRRKQYTNKELARNIVLAIEKGDMDGAEKYSNQLLKNVKDDESDYTNYVSSYLAENSLVIEDYAERYIEDPTVMNDALAELGQYYSDDIIMKAVRKYAKSEGAEVGTKGLANETSIYTGNDINRTLEKGDVQKAQQLIDEVNKSYAAMGSNTTAKNTITTYWKPKYLAASGAERDKILRMLYSLKSNGKQMYTAKEIAKWK